jgi:excisionase family DNA binding protein
MKTKKKTKVTEITVERSDVLVVRKSSRAVFAWCGQCAAEVRMCTPEEAATLARVSTRTIYRWVEAGKVHFTETVGGPLLICLNSLLEK